MEKESLLLVVVHLIPGPLGTSIGDFILLINELPTQHRILIIGDFNRDQSLCENVAKADPLIQNFAQRSQYSTHTRGLLDLPCIGYFRSQAVSSLPSPYSDHLT